MEDNNNRKFDANKYIADYQKKHYKRVGTVIPADDFERVDKAIKASGMSKSAFVKQAIYEKLIRDNLI